VSARLPRILIALALASSIGLHWTFLQAVAWAGMIVGYAQEAPLSESVVKTFDGRHPCKLCKQIANEKKSEKKSEYKFESRKLEFPYAPVAFRFRAPGFYWEVRARNDTADLLSRTPPIPPPRTSYV
jgi:hypothetical protein